MTELDQKLEPGHRLDRYELLCPIAQGGMAAVWLARQHGKHGFEKLVAVKTILATYANDLRFQQMFLDEARIASGIEHPNVAQILDLGEESNVLYIAMEWVDGDSLSKLFRAAEKAHTKLPVGIVCRILADTSAGLHAAHELHDKSGELLNVVHRDVSPQNVLVSTKGQAKLIDFGIAKARDRVAGDTNTGLLKGKILYMSPEQALGKIVDRRADVWAIGAVLYHMLAGVPPFEGANQLATLHLLTQEGTLPPLPPEVPPAVRDIVERTLVRDPEKRIGTAEELQRLLEAAMVSCGIPTTSLDVASFVNKQLTERVESRRKAVELALDAARQRQKLQEMIRPPEVDSASGVGILRTRSGSPPKSAPSGPSVTSLNSLDGVDPSSLPSSATLGSAAVVTPTSPLGRNRRVAIVGAVLGVCALVAAMATGIFIARSGANQAAPMRPSSDEREKEKEPVAAAATTAIVATPPSTSLVTPPPPASVTTVATATRPRDPGTHPTTRPTTTKPSGGNSGKVVDDGF